VVTRINNRKILSGIAEVINEAAKITDITVAVDKLDKIGLDAVNEELKSKGVSPEAIGKLQPVIQLKGSTSEKLSELGIILSGSETGVKGIEEMRTLFEMIADAGLSGKAELDLTLARGLNYYTGAIIEVKSQDVEFGSI
jgi:histidyl-tRNA synthetase